MAKPVTATARQEISFEARQPSVGRAARPRRVRADLRTEPLRTAPRVRAAMKQTSVVRILKVTWSRSTVARVIKDNHGRPKGHPFRLSFIKHG